mmetsp:Transcript_34395/g.95107  ORF Transcript_34395/g.95107 Transcript_34395/m.95107 type:complete len:265 (-) Transcript_34395:657-1451(-)
MPVGSVGSGGWSRGDIRPPELQATRAPFPAGAAAPAPHASRQQRGKAKRRKTVRRSARGPGGRLRLARHRPRRPSPSEARRRPWPRQGGQLRVARGRPRLRAARRPAPARAAAAAHASGWPEGQAKRKTGNPPSGLLMPEGLFGVRGQGERFHLHLARGHPQRPGPVSTRRHPQPHPSTPQRARPAGNTLEEGRRQSHGRGPRRWRRQRTRSHRRGPAGRRHRWPPAHLSACRKSPLALAFASRSGCGFDPCNEGPPPRSWANV